MSQMRGFGGLKTKSLVSSYASCKPARQHTLQLTVWLLLHSSVLICMQYPINISAFNPKLDNIRGTWMSSVSERLLKEIKIRLAPSKYLSANIKNAILLFSGLLLEFFLLLFYFKFVTGSRVLYTSCCSESMSPPGLLLVMQSKARVNRCLFWDYAVQMHNLGLSFTLLYLSAKFT